MQLGLATASKHRAKLVRRRAVALPSPCVVPELSQASFGQWIGLGSRTGLVHWPGLVVVSNGKAVFGFVAACLGRAGGLPRQNEFQPLAARLLPWPDKAALVLG